MEDPEPQFASEADVSLIGGGPNSAGTLKRQEGVKHFVGWPGSAVYRGYTALSAFPGSIH